jgi:hypothetical protein
MPTIGNSSTKGRDGIRFNLGRVHFTRTVSLMIKKELEKEQSQEAEFGMSKRYAEATVHNFETAPRCGLTDAMLDIGSVESTLETLQREKALTFEGEVLRCVEKHARGDYGILDDHDNGMNERCLKYNISKDPAHIGSWGGRIFSKYLLSNGKSVYVITDFGCQERLKQCYDSWVLDPDSITTVMLPSDY